MGRRKRGNGRRRRGRRRGKRMEADYRERDSRC